MRVLPVFLRRMEKGKPLFFFRDLFVIDGREQWLFDCHKR